jgi:hypothetical protein
VIYSLIEYRLKEHIKEHSEAWEREILAFIHAIDRDPSLRERVSYRCLKQQDGVTYCHLAAAVDDSAVDDLKRKEFFKPYSERLRTVAQSGPDFTKLQVVGGTEVQL